MTPDLHPWLNTPEAVRAAEKAVQIPLTLLPKLALIVGVDELHSEALAILTECALPPRDQAPTGCAKCGASLAGVRGGAKFCGPACRKTHNKRAERGHGELAPSVPQGHIGSMWKWPEDQRAKYAIREVGYVLNNYLRTRRHGNETPASETMANMNVAVEAPEETPWEFLERFLDFHGVQVSGDETFDQLAEAALHVRGETRRRPALVSLAV